MNWEQAESSQAESRKALPPTVLLRLADERPLGLVQNVGQGSVLLMLTGLDRNWTNWPADPTFVVFVLRGAAELAQGKQPPTSLPVGEKSTIDLGTEPVARNAQFLPPTIAPRPLLEYAMPETAEGATVALTLDPAAALTEDQSHLSQLLVAGVAELWTTLLDGRPQVKPIAQVVDGREGNLVRMERGALIQSLKPTTVEVLDAAALSERTDSTGNSARVLVLLALLGMTLLGEQLVAYSASYHQRPTAAGGRS